MNYLDAAFRNIYNKGLMVITSTDVSAIYGKCPQVTQRSYGAYTQKNDYYKEMAARVVLAAVARWVSSGSLLHRENREFGLLK